MKLSKSQLEAIKGREGLICDETICYCPLDIRMRDCLSKHTPTYQILFFKDIEPCWSIIKFIKAAKKLLDEVAFYARGIFITYGELKINNKEMRLLLPEELFPEGWTEQAAKFAEEVFPHEIYILKEEDLWK